MPQAQGGKTTLPYLFQAKRVAKYKKSRKFSCTASECLALFPPISHFIRTVVMPRGVAPEACSAFVAMADLIDQVHAGAQWKLVSKSS